MFFRDRCIRVEPEHEGIKDIDEVLNVSHSHVRTELLQQHAHQMHRPSVGLFEGIQQLLPTVCFHVIVVHGKQLQELFTPRKGVCNVIGQFLFRQLIVPVQYGGQILIPAIVFPLEKAQKELFLCLKVIIDGGTGKRCDVSDLLERDHPETHRLVELLTGIYNFFSFLSNLFRRYFSHLISYSSSFHIVLTSCQHVHYTYILTSCQYVFGFYF